MNRIKDKPLKTNIYLGKIRYGTYIIKNVKFVKTKKWEEMLENILEIYP